jgi:hypothetical protein
MPIPYSCIGDINTCSPQIRDYLLLRNLQFDATLTAYYHTVLQGNDQVNVPVDITAQNFISDPTSGHIESSINTTNIANQRRAALFSNNLYADAIFQNGYYNTVVYGGDALNTFVDTEAQVFITNNTVHPQSSIEIDTVANQRRQVLLAQNMILDTITNNGGLMTVLNSADAIGAQIEIGINPTYAQVGQNPNAIETPATDIRRDEAVNSNIYKSSDGYALLDIPYSFTNPTTQSDLIDASGNIVPLPPYTSPVTYPKTGYNFVSTLGNAGQQLRNALMGKNKYTFNNEEIVDVGRRAPGDVANQTTEYLDDKHQLNVGGADTQPANIIGSLLTGGLGFSDKGLVPNFDLRGSLAGRVLTVGNIINDTPLGRIGAQQMAFALGNNAAFNLQQETIGHINLNPLSLLTGHDLIVPNYNITVSNTSLGKALDFTSKLLGFQMPASEMDADSWVYGGFRNAFDVNGNNTLISNTGKGQVVALFSNLDINKFRPAYSDKRLEKDGTNGNFYNFPNKISNDNPFGKFYIATTETVDKIPVVESQQEYQVWPDYMGGGPASPTGTTMANTNGPAVGAFYGDLLGNAALGTAIGGLASNPYTNPESLLYKTHGLFAVGEIKSMVNRHSKMADDTYDQIQTAGRRNAGGDLVLSKGSAIQGEDGKFCRTWSTLKQYNRVGDLQKHRGLDANTTHRYHRQSSVLDDNGIVRVSPYYGDDTKKNMKRFMFSIENLAWADNYADLPPSEQGPGDPLNPDMKGRIMWFPPYDINFTDNTSVNWETTTFIGRSEPVYTYSNTERTGTLQFKVIADHPSMMNDLRFTADKYQIEDIMAGCKTVPPQIKLRLTDDELNAIDVRNSITSQSKASNYIYEKKGTVYFPNAVYDLTRGDWANYETSAGNGITIKEDSRYGAHVITYPRSYNSNSTAQEGQLFWTELQDSTNQKLKQMVADCKGGALCVEVKGYASKTGIKDNPKLANDRANALKAFFVARFQALNLTNPEGRVTVGTPIESVLTVPLVSDYVAQAISDVDIKSRKADFRFYYNSKFDNGLTPDVIDDQYTDQELTLSLNKPKFINEAEYFFKMQDINKFVYDDIRQKLRWFHPAFHSTTPEGLNSRLTFLQQCGRQGSTGDGSSNPDNLAFGRPPICILRIGDFYHTKIVIDSINFTYEPLIWDLNPEGIGVQPMLATVDLNFKFIGGSSLEGPLARLQNAVSFNFFANNEVYSQRPDYIENGVLKEGYKKGAAMDINVNPVEPFDNKPKTPVVNQVAVNDANNAKVDPEDGLLGLTPTTRYSAQFTISFDGDSGNLTALWDQSTTTTKFLPQGEYQYIIRVAGAEALPPTFSKSASIEQSSVPLDQDSLSLNLDMSASGLEFNEEVYVVEIKFNPLSGSPYNFSKMKLNFDLTSGSGKATKQLGIYKKN